MLVRLICIDLDEQRPDVRALLAKSGARSDNMMYQAQLLLERLKDQELCDWKNDWKVITLFIGVRRDRNDNNSTHLECLLGQRFVQFLRRSQCDETHS